VSDDLKKRLREADSYNKKYYGIEPLHQEAEDRIEQLEKEKGYALERIMELDDRIEQLERERHEYFGLSVHWRKEADVLAEQRREAEDKLAKAMEALRVSLEGLNWAKAYLSTSGIESVAVIHADATVYAALAELTPEGNP